MDLGLLFFDILDFLTFEGAFVGFLFALLVFGASVVSSCFAIGLLKFVVDVVLGVRVRLFDLLYE